MKNLTNLLILVLAIFSCGAVQVEAQTRNLYSFLRNDAGARAAALSGAFVSVTGDPGGVFYNPASARTVAEGTMGVTFLKHVLDINSGMLSYNNTLEGIGDEGSFAVSANYVNYGSFDRADRNGNVTGDFGAFDLAFAGTYANDLDSNFHYGVTLKFVANALDEESSQAVAVDAGLLYTNPEKRFSVGLAVLHVGTQISNLSGVSEDLPVDLRLGANHRLRGLPLLLNVSFHRLADESDDIGDKLQSFAIGGELYLSKALQLRLGYDNKRRSDLSPDTQKKLAGFSGGLGVIVDDFYFDYGVSSYGQAGELHRFSLNFAL